jgi:transposase InsO family protein
MFGVSIETCFMTTEPPTIVDGEPIHAILGMDYIKHVGGFSLRFNEDEKPVVAFDRRALEKIHIQTTYTSLSAIEWKPLPLRTIEMDDFVLEQFLRNDPENPEWKYKWIVTWKWKQVPAGQFGPPVYRNNKIPPHHWELLDLEVRKWIENEFLVPITETDRPRMKGSVPIKAEIQLHKPSTPVRPVCDFKWLNEYIKSAPNEGLMDAISAPTYIRRWRSHPESRMCLIDIKKAYMRIYVNEEQTYYQCVRYPDFKTEWRLTRLGFGLNIAPKVLRVVLNAILPQGTFPELDIYIDDNFLPTEAAVSLTAALKENGMECKDPELVSEARVLGLQNHADGTWSRRTELPLLEAESRRGVHSWTGRLIGHLPVANWLRPCCSALKRLTCAYDWDEPLPPGLTKKCKKLHQMLIDRGDPATGKWSYDKEHQWTLYTDASSTAHGAVLLIGEVYVEDRTWLRKPGDKRHINVAELNAVKKGIDILSDFRKALRMTDPMVVDLKCDNKSAVSWLNRANERHWTAIKGVSSKVIEKLLHDIADSCKALNIKLKVELIPSEENKSDPLSRVPEFLRDEKEKFDPTSIEEVICTTVISSTEPLQRDEYKRVVVNEDQLRCIMNEMHEHEGAQSLYDRLRTVVSHKELRRRCQDFVRNCLICSTSKVIRHSPIQHGDAHMEEPTGAFSHVHVDIAGPYSENDGMDSLFIISLIDRETRFVLARPSMMPPTGADAAALLRTTLDRFHVCVDVVYTDPGTQLRSTEFSRAVNDLQVRHVMTPVRSSWANGRIERWHRIVNERLRAASPSDGTPHTFAEFAAAVRRAVLLHNTAKSSRTGESPHEQVFTFNSWIHPKLKAFRPSLAALSPFPQVDPQPQLHPLSGRKLPREGEIWLYRTQHKSKLQKPYVPCRIITKNSTQVYKIRLKTRHLKTVHLRYLKELTPEAAAQLPREELLPLDERPLRDRTGGGGHVAGID